MQFKHTYFTHLEGKKANNFEQKLNQNCLCVVMLRWECKNSFKQITGHLWYKLGMQWCNIKIKCNTPLKTHNLRWTQKLLRSNLIVIQVVLFQMHLFLRQIYLTFPTFLNSSIQKWISETNIHVLKGIDRKCCANI